MESGTPADGEIYDLAPEAPSLKPVQRRQTVAVPPAAAHAAAQPAAPKPVQPVRPARGLAAIAPPAAIPVALDYRHADPAHPRGADEQTLRDLYLPLWLLGLGTVVELIAAFAVLGDTRRALRWVGVDLIAGTALSLGALWLAFRLRQIPRAGWGETLLKLTALSVAPDAVVDLVWPVMRFFPASNLLAWGLGLVAEFTLLGVLFNLDESDTWYCMCMLFVARLAVYFALLGLGLRLYL